MWLSAPRSTSVSVRSGRAKLTGRDAELTAIVDVLLRRPAAVLIEGEPGMGRTRLLTEIAAERSDDLLALDEALTELASVDPQAAELVKLRYFAGMTVPEAADALGVARRTDDFLWAYARSWLLQKIEGESPR